MKTIKVQHYYTNGLLYIQFLGDFPKEWRGSLNESINSFNIGSKLFPSIANSILYLPGTNRQRDHELVSVSRTREYAETCITAWETLLEQEVAKLNDSIEPPLEIEIVGPEWSDDYYWWAKRPMNRYLNIGGDFAGRSLNKSHHFSRTPRENLLAAVADYNAERSPQWEVKFVESPKFDVDPDANK